MIRDASNCCSLACDDVGIRSKVCGVGGDGVVEGVVAWGGTGAELRRACRLSTHAVKHGMVKGKGVAGA